MILKLIYGPWAASSMKCAILLLPFIAIILSAFILKFNKESISHLTQGIQKN